MNLEQENLKLVQEITILKSTGAMGNGEQASDSVDTKALKARIAELESAQKSHEMKDKMMKTLGDKIKADMEATLAAQKEKHDKELHAANEKLAAKIEQTTYSIDDF